MELQRKIRYFVIVASLIIFLYQMNTALHNLMSNETVDSTEYIPISELDPLPVLTFCPRQKVNTQRIHEFGYSSVNELMEGNYK